MLTKLNPWIIAVALAGVIVLALPQGAAAGDYSIGVAAKYGASGQPYYWSAGGC